MPKHEGESPRMRQGAQRARQAPDELDDALRERALGDHLYLQPASELATTLRPQHTRNVSWRWHVRRRQRAE
jgi:hypothetical protein